MTTAAGPLVGGVLVAASGPELAYWVNAASFGVSALLLAGIPAPPAAGDKPLSRGHLRDLVDGISLVRRSPPLLLVLRRLERRDGRRGGRQRVGGRAGEADARRRRVRLRPHVGGGGGGLVVGGSLRRPRAWAARSRASTPAAIALLAPGSAPRVVAEHLGRGRRDGRSPGSATARAVVCNITARPARRARPAARPRLHADHGHQLRRRSASAMFVGRPAHRRRRRALGLGRLPRSLLLAAASRPLLARGLRLDEDAQDVLGPRPHAVEAVL